MLARESLAVVFVWMPNKTYTGNQLFAFLFDDHITSVKLIKYELQWNMTLFTEKFQLS